MNRGSLLRDRGGSTVLSKIDTNKYRLIRIMGGIGLPFYRNVSKGKCSNPEPIFNRYHEETPVCKYQALI